MSTTRRETFISSWGTMPISSRIQHSPRSLRTRSSGLRTRSRQTELTYPYINSGTGLVPLPVLLESDVLRRHRCKNLAAQLQYVHRPHGAEQDLAAWSEQHCVGHG